MLLFAVAGEAYPNYIKWLAVVVVMTLWFALAIANLAMVRTNYSAISNGIAKFLPSLVYLAGLAARYLRCCSMARAFSSGRCAFNLL